MNIRTMLKSFAVLTATTMLALGAQAADTISTWKGGSSGIWEDNANWSKGDYDNYQTIYNVEEGAEITIGTAAVTIRGIAVTKSFTLNGTNTAASLKFYDNASPCIRVSDDSVLTIKGTVAFSPRQAGPTVAAPICVDDGATLTLTRHTEKSGGNGYATFNGAITGSGTIKTTRAGSRIYGAQFTGDNSGFAGTFTLDSVNGYQYTQWKSVDSGSANAVWQLGAGTGDNFGINIADGGTIKFGELTGTCTLNNLASDSVVTLELGGKNTDFTCGMNVCGMGVKKVGTGAMTWSGSNASALTVAGGSVVLAANTTIDYPITCDGGTVAIDLSAVTTKNIPVTVLTLSDASYLDLTKVTFVAPDGCSVITRDTTDPTKLVVTIAKNTDYVWTGNGSDSKWSTVGNWKLADGSDASAYPTGEKTVIFPQTLAKAEVTIDASEGTDKNKYILAGGTVVFNCATTLIGTSSKVHLRPLTVLGSGVISLKNACFQTVNYKTFTINNDLVVLPTDGDDPWADYSELYVRGKGGNYILNGKLTGSGRLKFVTDGNLNEYLTINGDASDFTGKLYLGRKTILDKDVLDFAQAAIQIDDGTDGLQVPSDATASVLKIGQLTGDGILQQLTGNAFTLEVGAAGDASYTGTLTGSAAWTVKKVGTGMQTFTDETVAYNVDLTAGELGVPNGKMLGAVALNGGKFKFTIPESWTSGETNTLFTCESGVEAGTDPATYVTLDTSVFTSAYLTEYDNTEANVLKVSFKSSAVVWNGPSEGGYWSDASNWLMGGKPVASAPGKENAVEIGANTSSILVDYDQEFGTVSAEASVKLTVLFTAKDQAFTAPGSFAGTIEVADPFTATEEGGVYTAGDRATATYTWAGNDGVWTDAKNWLIAGKVTGVYPTANDQAVFDQISTVSLSSDVAISNLTFNADVVLTGPGHNLYNIYDIDGTGKIVMSNMTLKTKCTFEMDNDIEIAAGTDNVFYEGDTTYKTVTLNGNLSGSGYIQFKTYRRNTGFLFKGDNTAFSGTADLWDDNTKDNCWRGETSFYSDKATSANAIWNIIQKGGTGWDSSDKTGAVIYDEAGTNKFGALNGPIAYGGNYYNKTLEIGARNVDCACRINGVKANRNFDLVKVGTAKLTFSGQSFRDYIVCDGTLELDTVNAVPGGEIRFVGTGDEQGFVSFTESFTNTVDNSIYDLSSKIKNSTAAIGIDTAGFDVSWATAIKASNVGGLTKKGEGTLTIKKVALNGALQVLGGKIAVDEEVTAEGQELLSWDVVDGAQEVTLSDFAFGTTPGGIGYAIVTNDTKVSIITERVAATYGYQGADGGVWTEVTNWNVDDKATPYYPDEDDAAVIGENVTITTAVGQVVKTLTIDASSKLAFDLSGIAKNEAVTLFTVGEGTPLTQANVLFSGYDETKYYLAVTEGETAMTVGLYDLTKFVWTGKVDAIFGTAGNWVYGVENGPTAETAPTANSTVTFPASFTEGVAVTFDGNATDKGIYLVLDCDVTFASNGNNTRTIYPWSIKGEGTLSLANYINIQTVTGKDMTIDVDINVLPSAGDDPWAAYAKFYLRGEKSDITFNGDIKGTGYLYLDGDGNPTKYYYINGDMSGFSGKLYTQYSWNEKKSHDETVTTRLSSSASLSLGAATLEVAGRVWVTATNDTATLSIGALYGTGVINNYNNAALTLEVGALNVDASSSVKLANNYDVGAWTITKVGTGTQTFTESPADTKTLVNVEAGALVLPKDAPFTLGESTHWTLVGDTRVFTKGTPNKPVMIFVR